MTKKAHLVGTVLFPLCLALRVFGEVDVLTQHGDNARTGANLAETVLTPTSIKGRLHKLAYRIVDGNVYAQPLIVAHVAIKGRAGPVNVAIVATEHNSIYAFDAEDTNQNSANALLWHVDETMLGTHIESLDFYKWLGFPTCFDLTTEIGITSTPVIQITAEGAAGGRQGVVYVAAKSVKGGQYDYRLIALNLADGSKLSDTPIRGEVPGTGVGAVMTGGASKIVFNPGLQLNRPGLLLDHNRVYIAFGGHCDRGQYHGWLFAYDVTNSRVPKSAGVFCTTPNGKGADDESRAGIWMSGQGPAADDQGNVYVVTADGSYNGTTDFGDSVVRLKATAGGLQPQDWFTPQNQDFLKAHDVDLGSSGAMLVPDSHLLINGGKEGRMYLVDRNAMGKGAAPSLTSFQVTHAPDLRFEPLIYYNIHGTPVIWRRNGEMFVYVCGEEDPVRQYRLVPDAAQGWAFESATPFKVSPETAPIPNYPAGLFGQAHRPPVWMPGGFLTVTANGTNNDSGVLWVAMPFAGDANKGGVVRGVLRAFDASDISKGEIWDSEGTGNDQDHLGQFAKFCPPTVANGKVYMATFQQEVIGHDGIRHKMTDGDQPALVIYGL